MPPDIVRPVASTTVGCLITMAHRLGMAWSDFRIDEGKMRAAGSGRSFSTSIVRGMGLVVEYSTTGPHPFPDHEWRINSTAADQVREIAYISSGWSRDDLAGLIQRQCLLQGLVVGSDVCDVPPPMAIASLFSLADED